MTNNTESTAQTVLTKMGPRVWQSPAGMYTMRPERSAVDGPVYAVYGPQGERQTYRSDAALRQAGFVLRVAS